MWWFYQDQENDSMAVVANKLMNVCPVHVDDVDEVTCLKGWFGWL